MMKKVYATNFEMVEGSLRYDGMIVELRLVSIRRKLQA